MSRWIDMHETEEGFTLIEVLVALTILSIGLAALFGAFSQSMASAREAQLSMRARMLAQGALERSMVAGTLQPGVQQGTSSDGLSWRVEIARDTASGSTLQPVRVAVTVSWSAGGLPHNLTLSGLRFSRKGPQS